MSKQTAKELLDKYNSGSCTEEEKSIVESWFLTLKDEGTIPGQQKIEKVSDEVWASIPIHQTKVRRLWPHIAAAASVLLALSAGSYFLMHKKSNEQIAQNQQHDVAPGSNKAILYSHGKKIILQDQRNGLLTNQGNVSITKTGDGKIAYQASVSGQKATTEDVYDTLYAPRGGQQSITFADGTAAALNADTRIRFPERFKAGQRQVEILSGEANFEVNHDPVNPFRVSAKGQTIEDIGTNFNVNAYNDEPTVKTTLIRGIINVSRGKKNITLKPGQQAITSQINNSIIVKEVDVEAVTDWKNNAFYFKRESLASIMRRISRWYDVQVVYQDPQMKPVTYSGSVARFSTLSKVLAKLEQSGDTRFKIENKKIIVLK